MTTIAYCVSIVIGQKVEHKFLMDEFLIKKVCMPLPVVNCSLGTSETEILTVLLPTDISSVPMPCFFHNFVVCNET